MPNLILFDAELSSTAKLMFCYISSLCASTGSCRPRNKHLAEKFSLTVRQVQSILEELRPYISAYDDEQGRRMLTLTPEMTDEEGGCRKLHGGVKKMSSHSNSNSKEKSYSSEMEAEIEKIYTYWLKLMVVDPAVRLHGTTDEKRTALLEAQKRTRLTPKRKAHFAARLATMGLENCAKAIKAVSQSDWHIGQNPSNWKADIEFLFRNDEQIEKWANKGGGDQ